MAGKNVDDLLKAANSRDFHPIPLGIRIRGNIPTKIRQIESRNVVAMVAGSDPKLQSEAVIFTAHWDHLGIGPAGERRFHLQRRGGQRHRLRHPDRNGARLGRAAAKAAALGDLRGGDGGRRPACAARNITPSIRVVPLGKTALDLNFDGFYPFGRTKDVSVTGAERTTVWPVVRRSRASHGTCDQARRASRAGHLLPVRPFLARARGCAGVLHRPGHRL